MEKSQYNLCIKVLRRLDKSGILGQIVLAGSWCTLFYEKYFKSVRYVSMVKTRDIDFFIPEPRMIKQSVDVAELLKDMGFIIGFTGSQGYIRLEHPELIVEFLVPEKGRGTDKPYKLPQLGLNAQALRFMELLSQNTITVEVQKMRIVLPHPVNFGLHKLLVQQRRPNKAKSAKDLQDAERVLRAVVEKGETALIKKTFGSMPKKWQSRIKESIKSIQENGFLEFLQGHD